MIETRKQLPFKLYACELCMTEYLLENQHMLLQNACRDFLRNLIPDIQFGGVRRFGTLIPFCQPHKAPTHFTCKKETYSFEEQMAAWRECFAKVNKVPIDFLEYLVRESKELPHFMTFLNAIYFGADYEQDDDCFLTREEIMNMWEWAPVNVYQDFTTKFLLVEKKAERHIAPYVCKYCQNHLCVEHKDCKSSVLNEPRYTCEFTYQSNLELIERKCMPPELKALLSSLI